MGICRLIFKAQSVIKSFPADPTLSASVCSSSSAVTLLTLSCRNHLNEAERNDNSVVEDASILLSSPHLRSLRFNLCDKLVPDRRRPSPDIIDRVW